MHIGSVIVIIWLVIGGIAAGQRDPTGAPHQASGMTVTWSPTCHSVTPESASASGRTSRA